MKKSTQKIHKILSFLSSISLVVQSFAPTFSVFANPTSTFAQETTEGVEEIQNNENKPSDNQEVSQNTEPTEEVTPAPEVTPIDEPAPTTTQIPETTPEPTVTLEPTDIPSTEGTEPPKETGPPEVEVVQPEQGTLSASILENTNAGSLDLENINPYASATLTTDKADYAPTDTVVITGNGFNPGQQYRLVISSDNDPPVTHETIVTADEAGTFVYAYQLDGIYRPVYKVEAYILTSGDLLAETSFTDSDTGYKSPTSNASNGSGDDWNNPEKAYSNGSGYAEESNGERHRFYSYGFSIPSGASINGIEVLTDAWSEDSSGCQLGVDLSWNAGSSWTTEKTNDLTNSETALTFGGSNDTWNRTWSLTELDNANFRSRVRDIDPGSKCDGDARLDWIRIKVYYTEASVCGDGIRTGVEECDGIDGLPNSEFQCTAACKLELVEPKITICHATSSQSNPYNTQQPNKSADVSGHDGHNGGVYPDDPWGDIIPPFSYIGGTYAGKNWTGDGQAIWNNSCEVPCGSSNTYEKTSDFSNAAVTVDFRDHRNPSGSSNDGHYKISISEKNNYEIQNIWLDVSGDGQSGYVEFGPDEMNDFDPPGNQINKAKVEVTYICDPVCGNSQIETGEACDDGNTANGDGCSSTCQTETGTIIIDKVTDPAGSLQSFSFTPSYGTSFSLTDTDTPHNSGVLTVGTYTVTEQVAPGWHPTSIVCDDQNSSGNIPTAAATINLDAGETVTCIFTNTTFILDLVVTKTDNSDPVYTGSNIIYTINWSISGNSQANNLFLHDFPKFPLEINLSDNPGWEIYGSGYRYSLGNPIPPASGSVNIILKVPADYESTVENDVMLVVDDPANPPMIKYVEASQQTDIMYCGDGTINGNEQCDDLNKTDGDGCSSTCQIEAYCGDGNVNTQDEQCDDGNQNNDDYCSNECTFNQVCLPDVNMIVNGDFETPVVTDGAQWSIYDLLTPMLGWTTSWFGGSSSFNGQDRPEPAHLELHRGVNGYLPYSGSQHAELDTDWDGPSGSLNGEPASVKISQTLSTIPGYRYEIKYAYSPRPNESSAENKLQSWWDGSGLGDHQSAGGSTTSWTEYSYEKVATTNTTNIEFADQGTPNSLGTFLDHVSVTCLGPNTGTLRISKKVKEGPSQPYTNTAPSISLFTWGVDQETPGRVMGTSADLNAGAHFITENSVAGYQFDGWHYPGEAGSCLNPEGTTLPIEVNISAGQTQEIVLCNSRLPYCGDEVKNEQEECDGTDGVTSGQNFCSFTCHLIPIYDGAHTCPDGTVKEESPSIHTEISSVDPLGQSVYFTVGKKYLLEVNGTFRPTSPAGWYADAGYTTNNNWSSLATQYGIQGSGDNYAAHALLSDFGTGTVGVVDWGAYNSDHIYTKYYEPTSSQTQFLIGDRYGDWFNTSWQNQTGMNDNDGYLSIDVYECKTTGTISGEKFEDADGDGNYDLEENSMNGWTIQLFTVDDQGNYDPTNPYLTDITGSVYHGRYTFTVPFRKYAICEQQQVGWTQTYPITNNGCHLIELSPTNHDQSGQHFGNVQYGSIEGAKWDDKNGNGEWNGDEYKLAGWQIELKQNGQVVQTDTTDIQGFEFLNVLPGNYQICEVNKANWHQTYPTNNQCHDTVTVVAGQKTDDIFFGNQRDPVIINAYKIVCDKETDLPNWSGSSNITTSKINNFLASHPTCRKESGWDFQWGFADKTGQQGVDKLIGTHIGPADGTVSTCSANCGSNTNTGTNYNNWKTLGSTDANGLAQVIIYDLENAPGIWVRENLKQDYVPYTYPPQASPGSNVSAEIYCHTDVEKYDNYDQIVNPQYGQTYTCVALNALNTGSISGTKYEDINGNGIREDADLGIANWTIFLDQDGDSILGDTETSALTDQNGQYNFEDLVPGTYRVCEQIEAGWIQTSTPACYVIQVAGDDHLNNNFGNYRLSSISGMKFEDMNGNGVKDDGDAGLSGWSIYLDLNANGAHNDGEPLQVTDDSGLYTFRDLPNGQHHGGYTVREIQKDGWSQTVPESSYWFATPSNTHVTDANFGNFRLGVIQGRKYNNLNGNSVRNEGEPYLNGWAIRLYDSSWQLVASMLTGDDSTPVGSVANGQYRFENLSQGTYFICEQMQSDWTQTDPGAAEGFANQSGDPTEGSRCRRAVIHSSGQRITGRLFGNTQYSDIHGVKWNDLNGNGVRDCIGEELGINDIFDTCVREPLLPGWTIYIDDNENNRLDEGEQSMETSSDPNHLGWYWFENMLPGTYRLCEVPKAGWLQTYPTPSCHTVTLPYGNDFLFSRMATLNAVDRPTPESNFGNKFIVPFLNISKFNDCDGNNELPGGSVVFTLVIQALENIVNDVFVWDLPAGGFTYKSGSWTAVSDVRGDLKSLGVTTEPVYASPGKWGLGNMVAEETVTLTYTADISNSQYPGLYKDLAFAYGDDMLGGDVLANLSEDPLYFVGTNVNITKDTQQSSSVNVVKTGEVLGASTELPATGGSSAWVILALILMISGSGLLISGHLLKKYYE